MKICPNPQLHCHDCRKCRHAVEKLHADIDRLSRILDEKLKAPRAIREVLNGVIPRLPVLAPGFEFIESTAFSFESAASEGAGAFALTPAPARGAMIACA